MIILLIMILLIPQLSLAQPTVIAIVDTGMDMDNAQLTKFLWTNQKEIPGNRIDDDKNGFIDDVHGWDFVNNRPTPTDNHGHGTHVAGIIASEVLKNQTSEKSEIQFMILKYYDRNAFLGNTLEQSIQALDYAVKMGAHIINYSGGGDRPYLLEKKILLAAQAKGILVVAAAGNEGTNSDQNRFYPAGYGLSNILSVTAVDGSGQILKTSNFGVETVDLAAEGKNIKSWTMGNKIISMTGTSQATAFGSATAALLMAQMDFLKSNPTELIKVLRAAATETPALERKTRSGHLNTKRSLATFPEGISAFGVNAVNINSTSNQQIYWVQ